MIPRAARLTFFIAAAGVFSGCVSSRHLVFFTNTTIGVEIAAEPNATTPAKFVIGYKRAEGVIDPLGEGHIKEGNNNNNNNNQHPLYVGGSPATLLKPEGHSVLAKLNFGAGGAGANSSTTQWFATGEAAKLIAQAPGIAGAVTGSPEIAKAAAEEARVSLGATAPDRLSDLAHLDRIYEQLEKLSAADKLAEAQLAKMKAIDLSGAETPKFTQYKETATATLTSSEQAALAAKHSFTDLTTYLAALSESVGILDRNVDPVVENLKMTNATTDATGNFVRTAQADYAKQKELLAKLQKRVSEDSRLIAAVEYYAGTLVTRTKTAKP